MNRMRTAWFALPLIFLALPSCLIGSSHKSDYKGKHITEDTMSQLSKGATKSEVLEAFGEPSKMSKLDDGTDLWSWHYSKKIKSSGSVFLLLSTRSETTKRGTVYVRFDDGRVEKIWRTET